MVSWKLIIDVGHTAVMLPVAAAIAAWLLAGRAWKMAVWWCFMFACGLSLVAMSKIAFLGWDAGVPALGFKALSGHAFCATAVIPVLLFVVLQGASVSMRAAGVVLGILASLSLGALLVRFEFHTASEVVASFVLGSFISLGYMRLARILPAPSAGRWTVPLALLVFALAFSLKPALMNQRLVNVALLLSGRDRPYEWSNKLLCKGPDPTTGKGRTWLAQ
jgi:hypothetical protein